MPSIEIMCVGDLSTNFISNWPFAVARSQNGQSHRSPSRFQEDFNTYEGALYHLGNPNLIGASEDRCFFAYKLLSKDCQRNATFLEFHSQFRCDIRSFLNMLLSNSPIGRLVFTSDWQFGPEWTKRENPLSFTEFWQLHDSHQLWLNALYPILKDPIG